MSPAITLGALDPLLTIAVIRTVATTIASLLSSRLFQKFNSSLEGSDDDDDVTLFFLRDAVTFRLDVLIFLRTSIVLAQISFCLPSVNFWKARL